MWTLCQDNEKFLNGALIADKVVGKGAAALMICGGVKEVYADVMSRPARELLQAHGVQVTCQTETDRIVNRRGDGLCPVETLCIDAESLEEMYNRIGNFIKRKI